MNTEKAKIENAWAVISKKSGNIVKFEEITSEYGIVPTRDRAEIILNKFGNKSVHKVVNVDILYYPND